MIVTATMKTIIEPAKVKAEKVGYLPGSGLEICKPTVHPSSTVYGVALPRVARN